MLHSFSDVVCRFSFFLSREGILHSCSQLRTCLLVALLWSGRGINGESSMSSGSTESQYGLRQINGVPIWNGDILTLRDYETAALLFRAGLKQERAVTRLWANLQGHAKEMIRVQTSRL